MTFLWEVRKLLISRFGVFFLFAFCLLNCTLLLMTNQPSDLAQDTWKTQYMVYLEQLRGPLTQEKETFLAEESEKISQAKLKYSQLKEDYYAGSISSTAFARESEALQSILRNEQGFNVIYDQYRRIYEDPQNRYFTSTNGWSALLERCDPACYLLLIFLILFAAPLYCQEYQCRMENVALTTVHGGVCFGKDKPRLIILLAIILATSQFLIQLVYALQRYGLTDPTFPLQSVPAFQSCTRSISLWQASVLILVSRVLGAVLFVLLASVIAILARNMTLTVFLDAALAFLPLFGLREDIQFHLPLPSTGISASAFLQGSQTLQSDSGTTLYIFREVSWNRLITLGIAALLLILLCYIVILRKCRNLWAGK